jgi:hypothetical protein
MSSPVDLAESQTTTEASDHQLARHELLVDCAERHAALVELARRSDDFTVHVERRPSATIGLTAGLSSSGSRTLISRFHWQTDDCSLKPQSSRDVLIVLSFSWRGRLRYGCHRFIRMRSRAQ